MIKWDKSYERSTER